jgi:hypothetical protein
MESALSPAKTVLLAVHFASHADVDNLTRLVAAQPSVLRQELVLRILLTYLPETAQSSLYVDFLKSLSNPDHGPTSNSEIDATPVQHLSEQDASKKARKLRLLQLPNPGMVQPAHSDPLLSFLIERAYKVDEEAGMLTQLPELLLPFLDYTPAIRTWMASTILPLLRKEYDYYPQANGACTLREFQKLPDRSAVEYLLSQTGVREEDYRFIGRDLDGLIGPWLHNDLRWNVDDNDFSQQPDGQCPAWEQVLEWLLAQVSRSWPVAVAVVEQWDGPAGVLLGPGIKLEHTKSRQEYLGQSYIRAALATVYSVPESTPEASEGGYRVLSKVMRLLNQEAHSSLKSFAQTLPDLSGPASSIPLSPKLTGNMRNDLLSSSNPLTNPDVTSTSLLLALVLSAHFTASLGVPYTIRAAGDLAFLQDQREQKVELSRLIRAVSSRAPRGDDEYWLRARRELLWLHSWGSSADAHVPKHGLFGAIPATQIEVEILKAILSDSRFALARAIYEDALDKPLSRELIEEAVYTSALNAFDNASNPSRTRGGLKKCDDM